MTTCVLIVILLVVKVAHCAFWTGWTDPEFFGKKFQSPKEEQIQFPFTATVFYISFPKRLKIQPLHTGAIIERYVRLVGVVGCSVIDLLRLNRQPLRRGSFLELHLFLGLENLTWIEVQRYQKRIKPF